MNKLNSYKRLTSKTLKESINDRRFTLPIFSPLLNLDLGKIKK